MAASTFAMFAVAPRPIVIFMPPAVNPYDEVPYESVAYPQTHPDRLATVATLFGLNPPSVERCRVLELGCASGGNLLPMAQSLPGSRFVGIDLSREQIAAGQRALDTLGYRNVELRAMSIIDIDAALGEFDYIVCHGVFSWVPREVQEKILALCARQLSPQGVAYISYNTYPGWHMRAMTREMMRFHAAGFETAEKRVEQSRALLDFLAGAVTRKDGPYGLLLKQELDLLRKTGDAYLLHEHLEEVNEPLYFHQFARRAGEHGLRYLGESEVSAMAAHSFPAEVQETLRQLSPGIIEAEQYLDFLRHRMFRQTLLVHGGVKIQHAVPPERVEAFCLAAEIRSTVAPAADAEDPTEEFRGPADLSLKTRDPLLRAALHILGERWPGAVPFDELRAAARARVGGAADPARDTHELGTRLLPTYTASRFLELHVHPGPFTLRPGDRPVASPYARWGARIGSRVTNLRHVNISLSQPERDLLQLLDGTRDRDELEARITPPADATASDTLGRVLARFARAALLVA